MSTTVVTRRTPRTLRGDRKLNVHVTVKSVIRDLTLGLMLQCQILPAVG